MRKALIVALALVGGCDFLPSKDRSVELHGQVLDAQTRAPIVGALWGVSNTCGFGTLVNLAAGATDTQGRFVARYEYPSCGDPFFITSADEQGYEPYGGEIYGTGRVVMPPVLLEKRDP